MGQLLPKLEQECTTPIVHRLESVSTGTKQDVLQKYEISRPCLMNLKELAAFKAQNKQEEDHPSLGPVDKLQLAASVCLRDHAEKGVGLTLNFHSVLLLKT